MILRKQLVIGLSSHSWVRGQADIEADESAVVER